MTVLVVGATGKTGRLLVENLLNRGMKVKVIVRSLERIPERIRGHENLSLVHATLLDLTDDEIRQHLKGCSAIASCLGHNLTFKGIFGSPRRLVTNATRRLCDAAKSNRTDGSVKFVLMNTTANANKDLSEKRSFAEKIVIGLIRLLLPPQVDNEKAADYLRTGISSNDPDIEWVAVRPDTLIDEDTVTPYELHPSPIRSPIFNAGKTSRINVGDFMADLIADDDLWNRWKSQMPVIYNKEKT